METAQSVGRQYKQSYSEPRPPQTPVRTQLRKTSGHGNLGVSQSSSNASLFGAGHGSAVDAGASRNRMAASDVLGRSAVGSPSPPQNSRNVQMSDFPVYMSNLRSNVQKEEAAVRAQFESEFDRVKEIIVVFEEKMVIREARCRRFQEAEMQRILKRVETSKFELLHTDEPSRRSLILSLEQKCLSALLHVLSLERAVLLCAQQLQVTQTMEHHRRVFLVSFEERERRELEDAHAAATAWLQPGMKCLGRCPFIEASKVCPLRGKNRYRLQIAPQHFTAGAPIHSPDRGPEPMVEILPAIPRRA